MRHIPYGAGGPYADLVAGQLPLMFDTLSPFLPNVKAGKLRALALSGKQRRPQIAEIPTFIEAGLPGFDSSAWYGGACGHAQAGDCAHACGYRRHAEIG